MPSVSGKGSMIRVLVNGEPRSFASGASLEDVVVAEMGLRDTRGVAVAVNRQVVPRGAWSSTKLSGGEAIEILVAAQGG
jgi:sulfur carrier protein